MPIFTAIRTPASASQNPQYKARGIVGLTSAKISSSGIFGFPTERQVAYDVYKTQIASFLYATATQTKVKTNKGGYKFSMSLDSMIAFPRFPPLHFRPKGRYTETELVDWKRQIREITEYEEVPFGKGVVYIVLEPSLEIITKIKDVIDLRSPGPSNSANAMGIRSLVVWKKIMTAFMATHTYPAWQTDEDTEVSRYSRDVLYRISDGSDSDNKKRALDIIAEESKKRRKVGYMFKPETVEDVEDIEMDTDETRDIQAAKIVPVAKPAPFRPGVNFGPVSYVPAMGGHLFPYFHQCLDNDMTYVADVFRRHFLFNFDDDPSSCAETFKNWRAGFSSIVYTDAGAICQHMTFGVELALDTQTRVYYLVDSGEYLGFVLLGFSNAILAYSEIREALSAADLRKELQELSTHETSLAAMCKLLSELKLDGDEMSVVISPESVSTSRDLYEEIKKRVKETTAARREKFEKILRGLHFKETYRTPSVQSVCESLEAISDEDYDISSWPLFLHPEFVFSGDRVYEVLASFGPASISFININGTRYPIPCIDGDDYATSSDPTKNDEIPELLISQKALNVAIGDFRRMRKEVAIFQNLQERARANRNIRYAKNNGREEIWAALRMYIAGKKRDPAAAEKERGAPKQKKRKVLDRDDDFENF